MRVTGAMRMALAGLPITLIKVFGRWASESVLQYLRETVVQGQGSIITQNIQEGISALPLALKKNTAVEFAPSTRVPKKR